MGQQQEPTFWAPNHGAAPGAVPPGPLAQEHLPWPGQQQVPGTFVAQPGPFAVPAHPGRHLQPLPPARRNTGPWVVGAAVVAAATIGISPLIYSSVRDTVTPTSSQRTLDPAGPDSAGQQPQDGSGNQGINPWGDDDGSGAGAQGWPGSAGWPNDAPATGSSQGTSNPAATRASAALSTGVVMINTRTASGEGAGTGMVLTSDGQVLTSYHVVNGSTRIVVTVASTGKEYTASVVGHDQSRDVALLRLNGAKGLPTVKIDHDAVNPGTQITAVGNAGGQGFLTQVKGTITAMNQAITAQGEAGLPSSRLSGLLQTTAGVVPGDSGGPMYDTQGEVLGINAAAASSNETASQTGAPTQSYGVPIATAMDIVNQIRAGKESGGVVVGPKAFLGISMSAQSTGAGVQVADVTEGGAAAGAGMTAGSTITSVSGVATSSASQLSAAVSAHDPGDRVTVTWRDDAGASHTSTLKLGSSPVN